MSPISVLHIRRAILRWFSVHGRKHLPWQIKTTPYHVWISEIMLQQTQVNTVIPYYQRFIQHFPDIFALADAKEDSVLHLWSGLGYYARARHLHKTAKIIVAHYQGKFPAQLSELQQLPGVGRSTAAAILAMGMHKRAAILDGNVKRLFSRLFVISPWQHEAQLWLWAEKLAPVRHIAAYTQALMDLGALICTRTQPKCDQCPLRQFCLAYASHQQANFPGKKPKKILPVRAIQLLLLQDPQGRTLLEKRPSSGIWGGLWSLPEYPGTGLLAEYCRNQFACEVKKVSMQTTFRHTFTHFHWDITPVVVKVKRNSRHLLVNRRWVKVAMMPQLGIPAPIKKILLKSA